MPSGKIDPSADTYEPIPEGEEVVLGFLEVKETTTKETARERWSLEMVVEGGPYNGRKVWDGVTFIPPGDPGHGITRSFLRACGLIDHEQTDYDVTPTDLAGGNARARLKIETYQGKRNNRVDRWLSNEPVAPAAAAPKAPVAAAAPAAPAGAGRRSRF